MKTETNKITAHAGGFALILVMCSIILLLILGWGVLALGFESQVFAFRTADQITARTAADAGLTKALFLMNERLRISPFTIDSALPSITDEALPACNASYTCAVTGTKAAGYKVCSVGNARNQQRTINASIRLGGLYDYGIVVKQSAMFYSGTLIDGYNSSNSADKSVLVQVASVNPNPHSVIFKPGATIDGEVLFGVDYDFSIIYPPSSLPNIGTELYAKSATLTLRPTDSGTYKAINLHGATNPGILVIDGGEVTLNITGDISMGQGCQMIINPGASLKIFINGNWLAGNSDGINNETQIPGNFAIYGTGKNQVLDLKAKTNWYGTIYAPNANISMFAKNDVYGSIVANTLETKNSGLIMYDYALRQVDVDDLGVRFVIDRWSER
jgi:Tfp pilus assembly protein PilX